MTWERFTERGLYKIAPLITVNSDGSLRLNRPFVELGGLKFQRRYALLYDQEEGAVAFVRNRAGFSFHPASGEAGLFQCRKLIRSFVGTSTPWSHIRLPMRFPYRAFGYQGDPVPGFSLSEGVEEQTV